MLSGTAVEHCEMTSETAEQESLGGFVIHLPLYLCGLLEFLFFTRSMLGE